MFKRFSLFILTASLSILPAVSLAASGDTVTTANESIKKVETTDSITVLLPFSTTDLKALQKDLDKIKITLRSEKQNWTFQLLPETYSLETGNYTLVNDMYLPVAADAKLSNFPIVQRPVLQLSRSAVLEYAKNKLAPEINHLKQDVTIRQTGSGSIIFDGTAEDGQELDEKALIKGVQFALENSVTNLNTPTVSQPAKVNTEGLEGLQVKELIATGISDMSGSPQNRIHNIQTGLKRFNGIIIKQGANFSFNEQLGPVDGVHGFLPELVIKGPDTIPEFGGGLCQVSTTMFRAALLAGLPILERRNHSYAVSYYVWPMGWGFDATVYIGAVDMKFKNDTPGDIIVQAYTEGTRVYYKFYGIRDSRQVLISNSVITGRSGPPAPIVQYTSALTPGKTRVKEKAHAGLSAYFTRSVTMPDGTVKKEKITSVYQARPQVTLAGATDAPTETDVFYTGDIAP